MWNTRYNSKVFSSPVTELVWLEQKLCGPTEPHCHHAGRLLCFLICQSAPVDYSWLPWRGELISAVRSLCRSSDQAQEHTDTQFMQKMHRNAIKYIARYASLESCLTFTKLPSVAKWCVDWSLDCSRASAELSLCWKCKTMFAAKSPSGRWFYCESI